MKKTIPYVLLLTLLFLLALTFGACGILQGLNEKQTASDSEIRALYSAYEENGGTLSYADWLASVKGDKADSGVDISSIKRIESTDLSEVYTITFTDGTTTRYTIEKKVASCLSARVQSTPFAETRRPLS